MKIRINGKEQVFSHAELELTEVLKQNNVKTEMVSVQLNGSFLSRELFGQTKVKDSDELDFVYFMGGGEI